MTAPPPIAPSPPRPWTWPWLIAVTVSRVVLVMVVTLALWGAIPALFGWTSTTVSSGSMLPRLRVGDVAVSRPIGTVAPGLGTVLLYDDPDHPGRLRMHRLVAFDDQGRLITRGDANAGNDSTPVHWAAVRGIGTLRVPWIALPIVWMREGAWGKFGLTVLVLVAAGLVTAQSRRFGFDDPPDPPGSSASPDADRAAVDPAASPTHRAALSFGAVIATTGLLVTLAVPAQAAFRSTTSATATFAVGSYLTCAQAVDAASPYLWYRLDETSSTATSAADSSGNGRTGTYQRTGKTAGATRACPGDTGSAITFNGSSGYLSSPTVVFAPNTFTIEIWFKTTTTRGGRLIGWSASQTGESTVYDRHLYLTDAGTLVFGVYPTAVKTVSSTKSYNDGGWHHAAGTLSSAGMRLYVDGALIDSDTSVTTAESGLFGFWRIGYDNLAGWPTPPSSYFFAGTVDDAAVYSTALTPAQILAHYQAGSG